jgi:hypothetical protein
MTAYSSIIIGFTMVLKDETNRSLAKIKYYSLYFFMLSDRSLLLNYKKNIFENNFSNNQPKDLGIR